MQNEERLLSVGGLSESSTSSCSSFSRSSKSSSFKTNSQLIASSNDGVAIISKAEQVGSRDNVTVKRRIEETNGKDSDENSGCDGRVEQEEEQGRARKKRKTDRCDGSIIDEAEVDDEFEDFEEWVKAREALEEIGMYESELAAGGMEGHPSYLLESQYADEFLDYFAKEFADIDLNATHNSGNDEKMLDRVKRRSLSSDTGDPKLRKEAQVKALAEGVPNIDLNMCKVVLIRERQIETMMKQWARVKRGTYTGDIGLIEDVDPSQKHIRLKLLPRINYTKRRDASDAKRKRNRRPAAKPFNPAAIRANGGKVKYNGNSFIFEGNNYCRKGFLYKNYAMSAITTEGVQPTLSELKIFQPEIHMHFNGITQTSEKKSEKNFSPTSNRKRKFNYSAFY